MASIIFDFIDIWHTSADDHHCIHYCWRAERPIHCQGTISGELSVVYIVHTCSGMYNNDSGALRCVKLSQILNTAGLVESEFVFDYYHYNYHIMFSLTSG